MTADTEFKGESTVIPAGSIFAYYLRDPKNRNKILAGSQPVLTEVKDEDGFDNLQIQTQDGQTITMETFPEDGGKKSYHFTIKNGKAPREQMTPQEFYEYAIASQAVQSPDFPDLFDKIKDAVDSSPAPEPDIVPPNPNTPKNYEFITDGVNTLEKVQNKNGTTQQKLYCEGDNNYENNIVSQDIIPETHPQYFASSNGWSGSHNLTLPSLPAIPKTEIDGIKKWYTENLGSVSVAQIDKNNTTLSKYCAISVASNDQRNR